jgi:hypothetical protein
MMFHAHSFSHQLRLVFWISACALCFEAESSRALAEETGQPTAPPPSSEGQWPVQSPSLGQKTEAERLPLSPEAPLTMNYREGQPIPSGYHLEQRKRKGIFIAGATTLGLAHLASILPATVLVIAGVGGGAALFFPVAGPFVTLASINGLNTLSTTLFVADGLIQTAGLGMMIAGLIMKKPILVKDRVALDLLPLATPRTTGMALSLSF